MSHFKSAAAIFLAAVVFASHSDAQSQLRLTLQESIQIALRKSKVLAAEREKLKEAEAKRGEARAKFLPQIRNSSTYTRLDVAPYMSLSKFPFPMPPGTPSRIPMGDRNIYSVVTSVQQPLFTGFRLLNSYEIAQYGVQAHRFDLQKTRAEVIFNVENAYWGVVKAQQFEAVSEQAVKQMEAHVKDLENMYQVGMVAQNDLLRAKVQLSNTKLMRIKAANAIQMAKAAFCNALGIALNTDFVLDAQLKYRPMSEITLEEAKQMALRERPELKAMQYNLKIAQKAVALSRSQWLPNLVLIGNYNYKRPNRENEKKWYRSWDVTLALQMNIWDWGSIHYQTSQAQHRLRQAEEGFEQLKDGIILEVTQSYLALHEAAEKVTVSEENVAQAQENYRVTEERFKQGMATNTDVIDANTLLTQAKMDHIQALADYNIARARLKKAIGILKND
ncbi:MAG: TolC family protein [Candidatus Latescibacteria bacterium]|nr:TolC family protein [Candidatus Latescibacterota bacterium]